MSTIHRLEGEYYCVTILTGSITSHT